MTKEVEVGDEFPAAKVVKTTTFGAFVELAKGTDGLLHISNVSPGQRVDTVEDVLNKGDEIHVRVVEVDRERGRIGLRLAEDPDDRGQDASRSSPPSPASAAAADAATAAQRRPAAATAAGATATAARAARAARATVRPRARASSPAGPPADRSGLGRPDRHGGACPPCDPWRSGSGSAPARPARTEAQAGLSHLIEHMLFRGTDRYGSLEIDQLFDAMGAELNAGTGKETTSVYARVLDDHLPEAFDVISDMVWRPRFGEDDLDNEREIVLEEIAMYEDDPQDKVFDVLGEAVFGGHPLGRAIIGRADVVAGTPADGLRGVPRRALRARATW